MVTYQPNGQFVIQNLSQKLASALVENAMLQAVVDELSAKTQDLTNENTKLKQTKGEKQEKHPA